MDEISILSIISTVVTLVILPLIIDWIKRRWDYVAGISKAKFDVLYELSSLLWSYHGACSRVYGATYPSVIEGRTDQDIAADVEVARSKLFEASNALYNGLYSYQSKTQQYYDHWKVVNDQLDSLIDWAFHDQRNAMDDHFIVLTQECNYTNADMRQEAVRHLVRFRKHADLVLQPLATELREGGSFWYPLKRLLKSL